MRCLNTTKHGKCKVLKVNSCPEECFARVTNPKVMLDRMEEMLQYNRNNPQSCAEIRKDIQRLRGEFDLPEPEEKVGSPYSGLSQVYWEDVNRGSGGGSSEGNSNEASLKQKMKDNRPIECKPNSVQRKEVKEATEEWEKEHGKLPKLSRSPLSRNKKDSYTGEDLPKN